MIEEKRSRYFALGLSLSFIGFILAASVVPAFSVSGASPIAHESLQSLLFRVSNERIARELGIAPEGKLIEIDLGAMKVRLSSSGEMLRTLNILSRGREGTFWETPQGNYSIESKQPNHYSSIGHVWMPYSMQLFGNFFIHGWPYYQDGTPVSAGYSGGCVRLSTDDAKEVYDFADVGTPIRVVGSTKELVATTTFHYFLKNGDEPPPISASGFIAADLESGDVLWAHNATSSAQANGLSALLSALAAVETVDQYKTVRMSELLLGKPIPRKVEAGFLDEVPIGALVYPLLFSGNDLAAKAFAADHGERSFVRAMNEKAAAIGMAGASFASSTGSVSNTFSPRDAFMLLRYLRESKPFLLNVTLQDDHVVNETNGKEKFQWANKNPWLPGDAGYRGGLLPESAGGKSSAAAIWSIPLSEFGERPIAIIVLDSSDPRADIEAIRDFIRERFIYAPDGSDFAYVIESGDRTPFLRSAMEVLGRISRMLHG